MKLPFAPTSTTLFLESPKPWIPKDYMKKAVKFLLEHACGGLLLDPGLSKTAITLATIKILLKKGMMKKVLVVAPLRPCYLVWPKEQRKWKDFNGLRMVILHGPDKEARLQEEADIYVINPDGLPWLTGAVTSRTPKGKVKVEIDLVRWKSFKFDTLVVDELSKFKHTQSNRFKMVKLVLHLFSRRWGLTGSPASNGLMNLFGQCYVLDQGRSLGKFISHFRMQYFHTTDRDGYVWELNDGADTQIYERISPLMLRMSADDYLEMPELVNNKIVVELPPKIQKIYDRMEEDLIARINTRVVTAANAASASTKCRQIANGGIYLDPDFIKDFGALAKSDREWVNLHEEKINALEDLIDELQGQPLLIAYDFEHDLDRLRKRFGKDIPVIGGGTSMKRAVELEALWNQGKLPFLFGHPQAMAHGLNLQEQSCHVAWHSLTWDYELYDQFIRRVRRQGNTAQRVFSHHIVAKGTIDEDMLAELGHKEHTQQALFTALKNMAQRRRKNLQNSCK